MHANWITNPNLVLPSDCLRIIIAKEKNLLNQMLLGVLDLFLSRSLAHPYNAHKDTRGIGGAPRPIEYFVDKMLDWIKRQSHLGLQQDQTRNDLF